jgi:flagellar basal-body rod protein FlgC
MNLFGIMETSSGAMRAERMRAEVVAANMANVETTHTSDGGPYRRQHVVFAANQGDASFLSSMVSASGASGTGSLASSSQLTPGMTALSGDGSRAIAPGVEISGVVEDNSPPQRRYDPGHPDADASGYVSYPDINPVTEMVDLMGATRAYGLNSSAVQAEKSMISSSLDIAKS